MKSFLGASVRSLLLVGITGTGLSVSAAGPNVLIVSANPGSDPVAELMATGLFSSVNTFDAANGTPTLSDFAGYDSILAYSNFPYQNGAGTGNALADFVDAGGHVTLATYSYSDPWSISGRILTSGYSPLVNLGSNGDVSGALVPVNPLDPIFNGVGPVSYFHNSNFAQPGLDSGATLVATDGSGTDMIARSGSKDVVGLNLFPMGGNFGGNNEGLYRVVANSLLPGEQPTHVPDGGSTALMLIPGLIGLVAVRKAGRASTK